MPYTTTAQNIMLDALFSGVNPSTSITHVALFNGDPSGAGSELSGGSYARQAISFSTAAGGVADSVGTQTFQIPAGSTVSYVAFFDSSSAGTLLAYKPVTTEDFNADGEYTLTDADLSIGSGVYTQMAQHIMLDAIARGDAPSTSVSHVSTYDGDPSGAGVETSGGSYARKSLGFNGAGSGSISPSSYPTIDVPAGETINHAGFHDASTAGNLLAFGGIPEETYNDAGTYTFDTMTFSV